MDAWRVSLLLFLGPYLWAHPAKSCPDALQGMGASGHLLNVQELIAVTTPLRERFPAERFYFLGIGRSPFAVVETLREQGGSAAYLPLSYRKKRPFWEFDSGAIPYQFLGPYSDGPRQRVLFFRYLDQFFTASRLADISGRDLVLIDFSCDLGVSLLKAYVDVRDYFRQRSRVVKVWLVSLEARNSFLDESLPLGPNRPAHLYPYALRDRQVFGPHSQREAFVDQWSLSGEEFGRFFSLHLPFSSPLAWFMDSRRGRSMAPVGHFRMTPRGPRVGWRSYYHFFRFRRALKADLKKAQPWAAASAK